MVMTFNLTPLLLQDVRARLAISPKRGSFKVFLRLD